MSVMSVPLRFMPRIRTKRRRTKTAIQPQATTRLRACTKPRVTATKETAYRTAHCPIFPVVGFSVWNRGGVAVPQKHRQFVMLRRETAGATKLEAVGPVNWNAPEFWVDGGCPGNNAAHRKREAYGRLSDGKTIMPPRFAETPTNKATQDMTLPPSHKNRPIKPTPLHH